MDASGKYAFDYGRIRLTHQHYNQWKRVYRYLDLDAELTALEPWAARQDNWFMAVSSALAKRNRQQHEARLRSLKYNGIEGVL
jgi:hypothetical protein